MYQPRSIYVPRKFYIKKNNSEFNFIEYFYSLIQFYSILPWSNQESFIHLSLFLISDVKILSSN